MTPNDPLQRLIDNPSERLDVEFKSWIDPQSDDGKEKIVKACLALFNNNGGYLLVGIRDDGSPDDSTNAPVDVRRSFHSDIIQGLVGKYSFTPFEIQVEFRSRNGQEFPIILVPAGLTSPAVTKSQIGSIRPDEVYVRSLTSNNRVSSSKPKRRDWDRLIRLCLDNREADIGAFFRRHLGVKVDLDRLRASVSLPQSTEQQSLDLLEIGSNRFAKAFTETTIPDTGFVEIAIVIEGSSTDEFATNQYFLRRLLRFHLDYSGWPPFNYFANVKDWKPKVIKNGWEAKIICDEPGFPHVFEFWRIEPTGRFYTKRALQDDMSEQSSGITPLCLFDPVLHLRRIAEAIAIGLSFTEGMQYALEESRIAFSFRWTRLAGRQLWTWAHPNRSLTQAPKCIDDEATETVLVPANTPKYGIGQFVQKVGAGLMVHFEGYDGISPAVVEDIVKDTFDRRF